MTEKEYKQREAIRDEGRKYFDKVGSFYYDSEEMDEILDAYEAGYRKALEDLTPEIERLRKNNE